MAEYRAKDYFIYEVDFASIAANASSTGQINVEADSDFVWQKACYFADVAGAQQQQSTREIPLCSVLITDSGSGRQLMNSAVPLTAMFGTGDLPFILPQPKIFVARSTISVQVANFSAATTYRIRLSFIGTKQFR